MRIIKKSLLAYVVGEYAPGERIAIEEQDLERLSNHIYKRVENKSIAITRGSQLLMYAGLKKKEHFSPEQILRFIQNKEVCFAMASLIIEHFHPTGPGSLAVKLRQLVETIEALLINDVYTSSDEE